MTGKTEAQPEALRLADRLIGNAEIDECEGCNPTVVALERSAAAELRRQHAEIQQLKTQLSARQAVPDGWKLVPKEATRLMLDAMPPVEEDGYWAMYEAAISTAPHPPELEPLSASEVGGLLESAGYCSGEATRRADFINGLRFGEMAHGIGAPAEKPQ